MPAVAVMSWEAHCRGEQRPPPLHAAAGDAAPSGAYDCHTSAPEAAEQGHSALAPPRAGDSAQRCPLRDISNVAARAGAGAHKAKADGFNRVALQPAAPPATSTCHPSPMPADGEEEACEYVPSIFSNLFNREAAARPSPSYMDSQSEVTANMRGILVDWLVDVQAKYKMRPETLFLSVNLADRYLARKAVSRQRLQLVGVVAMLVAAKFEERRAPQLESLVYITDNAYSRREILDMECSFLAVLGFKVSVPTSARFLERLLRASRCDDFHRNLASYILELGLVEYRMLQFEPSRVAAAAVYLSNRLLRLRPVWPESLASLSRFSAEALAPCVAECQALLDGAPHHKLQAVQKKFSKEGRGSVARQARGL